MSFENEVNRKIFNVLYGKAGYGFAIAEVTKLSERATRNGFDEKESTKSFVEVEEIEK